MVKSYLVHSTASAACIEMASYRVDAKTCNLSAAVNIGSLLGIAFKVAFSKNEKLHIKKIYRGDFAVEIGIADKV